MNPAQVLWQPYTSHDAFQKFQGDAKFQLIRESSADIRHRFRPMGAGQAKLRQQTNEVAGRHCDAALVYVDLTYVDILPRRQEQMYVVLLEE